MRIVTIAGFVLYVSGGDGDSACLFLGRLVDGGVIDKLSTATGIGQYLRDGGRERRLAVI